ncbi:MAG: pyridoxal 5'-phosphate synthase glutaminase subunit PdxT [Fervidicoccaceae archaeon]
MRVGVLALQGGFIEHIHHVRRACAEAGLSCETVLVRSPRELRGLDALVLPGGESTTLLKLARAAGLLGGIRDLLSSGIPALATCAGAIVLAEKIVDSRTGKSMEGGLGLLSAEIARNYFGRQRESFEVDLDLRFDGGERFRAVFIRAPAFIRFTSSRIRSLAELSGVSVAVEQDNIVATAFHPELVEDHRVHAYALMRAARS